MIKNSTASKIGWAITIGGPFVILLVTLFQQEKLISATMNELALRDAQHMVDLKTTSMAIKAASDWAALAGECNTKLEKRPLYCHCKGKLGAPTK